MQSGNAAKTIRTFFDACLVRRDADGALACFTENVQWMGMGKTEPVTGRVQAGEALRNEFVRMTEYCRIEYGHMEESAVTDTCSAVLLTASVYAASDALAVRLRASAVCEKERDGAWRIASIHVSVSDSPDISAEAKARERLEKQTAYYDKLFNPVLTGIVQYRVTDCGMTFKNANQEAIRL